MDLESVLECLWWCEVDVLLLPGMDGTGRLYSRLEQTLPKAWQLTVIDYPVDAVVAYDELLTRISLLAPERPFMVVAESYSTPLAVRFAATHPEYLKGLVLCAGFASCPVIGLKRFTAGLISPVLFHLPLSDWALRYFLIDERAESSLVDEVRAAIASVRPSVLTARLREILNCNVLIDMGKVVVPMLYLQATHDRLISDNSAATMRQYHGDLIVQTIDGPHLLFQREPEQTADAIEHFVRSL